MPGTTYAEGKWNFIVLNCYYRVKPLTQLLVPRGPEKTLFVGTLIYLRADTPLVRSCAAPRPAPPRPLATGRGESAPRGGFYTPGADVKSCCMCAATEQKFIYFFLISGRKGEEEGNMMMRVAAGLRPPGEGARHPGAGPDPGVEAGSLRLRPGLGCVLAQCPSCRPVRPRPPAAAEAPAQRPVLKLLVILHTELRVFRLRWALQVL